MMHMIANKKRMLGVSLVELMIALVIAAMQQQRPEMNVGVVGLGCGVLAAYGREADQFDMIEINPAVIEIGQLNRKTGNYLVWAHINNDAGKIACRIIVVGC